MEESGLPLTELCVCLLLTEGQASGLGNDFALTPRCDLATQSGQTAQSKTEKRGLRIYLVWNCTFCVHASSGKKHSSKDSLIPCETGVDSPTLKRLGTATERQRQWPLFCKTPWCAQCRVASFGVHNMFLISTWWPQASLLQQMNLWCMFEFLGQIFALCMIIWHHEWLHDALRI